MRGKYTIFLVLLITLVAGFWGATILARQNTALPSGVTTTPPLTAVTRTTTPTPTPTTVTVTVSPKPVWPTVTAQTLVPPVTKGCQQDGRSTADWNTDDDTGNGQTMVSGPIADVLPSAGACYDTIVFRVASSDAPGFVARYVPQVTNDPMGVPVPLFGMADLQLTIFAPVDGASWNGYDYRTGSEYGSLRHIKFAGSFEGVTTFGIGVKDKVPFAVEYSHNEGSGSGKVIVYLAHE